MKIRRFFGPDMRQAIRKVERELGPDAVILSNKKVMGGVEVVAAMDFDHTLLAKPQSANPPAAVVPEVKQPAASPEPVVPAAAEKSAPRVDANFWSQDPALKQIQTELNDLRGLLERQLSGFAWGDEARRHPVRAHVMRELAQLGLTPEHCRAVAERIPDDLGPQRGWLRALDLLAAEVPVVDVDPLEQGGIVALVGPTGVGKTTTIAKLAARYALRKGRKSLALVTIDNYRIGAHEQLRTYGRILDVPVYAVKDAKEMRDVLAELVDRELVLIDTAGMSQRDPRIAEQFAILDAARPNLKTWLVLSATTHATGLTETARVFRAESTRGCILTKVDETAQLGGALSVAIGHTLPVAYVSDGQRVPEDIQVARGATLVQRAVALMLRGNTGSDEHTLENAYKGAAVNAHV